MRVGVREGTGFDFEAVIPIATPKTLGHVAGNGEGAGLPLFNNVAILVEHQPGVVEEVGGAVAQIDPAAASGGNGAAMKADEQGVLEDPDVVYGTVEQHLE
jgi:hypothetical protein